MPTPRELYERGELKAAIEALGQELRGSPADAVRRTFLFELLSFAGDWDRAEKQIDVVGSQSPELAMGVSIYRGCLAAERLRARLFSSGLAPRFLSPAPAHVLTHLRAIDRLREGDAAEARRLFDEAEEARPALSCKVNGRDVEDFRDYEETVAPVLELFHKDEYVWMPLEQVRHLEIAPPKKLRDLVWALARIEAFDGTTGDVFMPCLYAGSTQHADDRVRLGRMTDWRSVSEDLQTGAGLRTFLAGEDEVPVLELRELEVARVPEG